VPLEAAEGGITLAEENLRLTLADCARFRTWCGATNQAAALAKIFIDDLPVPPNDQDAYTADDIIGLRPFAILMTANQAGYSKARVATETYPEAGKLAIALEENVPAHLAGDVAALERQFKNTIGVIIDELLELAYQAGYLAIDLVTFHGPLRSTKDDAVGEGDHHWAILELQYGIGVR
jgi:hypothetical protein